MNSPVCVLLDTNVWLAILTTEGFCRRMWRRARRVCRFFACAEILQELEEKLRLKFGFSSRQARLMMLFVQRQTEMIRIASAPDACRDKDDNLILAAALDSGCSYLVTGDADLLLLKGFAHVTIVTPREFLGLIPG